MIEASTDSEHAPDGREFGGSSIDEETSRRGLKIGGRLLVETRAASIRRGYTRSITMDDWCVGNGIRSG